VAKDPPKRNGDRKKLSLIGLKVEGRDVLLSIPHRDGWDADLSAELLKTWCAEIYAGSLLSQAVLVDIAVRAFAKSLNCGIVTTTARLCAPREKVLKHGAMRFEILAKAYQSGFIMMQVGLVRCSHRERNKWQNRLSERQSRGNNVGRFGPVRQATSQRNIPAVIYGGKVNPRREGRRRDHQCGG